MKCPNCNHELGNPKRYILGHSMIRDLLITENHKDALNIKLKENIENLDEENNNE